MRTKHLLLSFFILAFLPAVLSANQIVKHLGIAQTNLDVSNSTVVGELTIDPAEAGKVIVRFDGKCISTPGDRIVLAASNTTSWGTNDGAVSVEAVDADLNRNNFSHTRVYDVTAGTHTFYAIAHNYVETAGDGIASIYGSLTVQFIPDGEYLVGFLGIAGSGIDVSNSTVVGEVTIAPATAGTVIVRFDGKCISTPGDRIVLAASNSTSWGTNDGAVSVEAVDADLNRNNFAHTRVYDVAAGSQTFYAIAHNYVETAGDGIASVYGSLTVQFIPAGENLVGFLGIAESGIDVSTSTVVGEINIEPAEAGKVIVRFDGKCISTPGDRIVLAASDTDSWGTDDGSVSVEAIDADLNRNNFAHTRVYDVAAGSHTFYAIAHNYVETAGDGIASVYGSLTAEFVPEAAVSVNSVLSEEYHIFPNPARDILNIEGLKPNSRLTVYAISGQELRQAKAVTATALMNISDLANGIYFLKISAGGNDEIIKFIKD